MSTKSAIRMFPYRCPTHQRDLSEGSEELRCPSGHSFPIFHGNHRSVPSEGYAESFGRGGIGFASRSLTRTPGSRSARSGHCDALGCLATATGWGARWRANTRGWLRSRPLHGDTAGTWAIVTSVDLSSGVDANAVNFPLDEVHRIVQADVRALPFSCRQFDGVFCLGVVQHTPSLKRR